MNKQFKKRIYDVIFAIVLTSSMSVLAGLTIEMDPQEGTVVKGVEATASQRVSLYVTSDGGKYTNFNVALELPTGVTMADGVICGATTSVIWNPDAMWWDTTKNTPDSKQIIVNRNIKNGRLAIAVARNALWAYQDYCLILTGGERTKLCDIEFNVDIDAVEDTASKLTVTTIVNRCQTEGEDVIFDDSGFALSFNLIREKLPVDVVVNGPATIATATTAAYTCIATWNDGTTSPETPTWSVTPTTYASVSTTGIVTNLNTTTNEQTATLTATYTVNGVSKTDSKTITLAKKELTGIAIGGDATIATASTATYTCTASWSYGGTTPVTPTWTINPTTYASVNTAGVVTNKNTTTTDQTVTLNASYTVNGVTKTASLEITLEGSENTVDVQTLPLTAGWNWVGFYVLPTSHKVGDVLGTAGFTLNDIIQTNDGVSRFNGTGWLPSGFTVESGRMYQIYVDKNTTVEITGSSCETSSVDLTSGWNWISNPTNTAFAPSQLTHSGGWTTGDRIQSSSAFVTYSGSGWIPSSNFLLEPGKGYQIRTANAGTLSFAETVDDELYVVVDLSGGPDATHYPVRYSSTGPDLDDDICRTSELWLRKIPAGKFIMGSPENELGRNDNETQHEVTLTQDYYIGVFECTQRQWELVMGTRPSYFSNEDYYSIRPVEQVSYDMIRGTSPTAGAGWPTYGHTVDATSFMGKLQAKTGLTFDLPTEAQWEYVCRAGTTTALNSGKNLTDEYEDAAMAEVGRYSYNGPSGNSENFAQNYGTAKVGSYLPNNWSLYDMHGNVHEWCLDWWGASTSSTASETDPVGTNTGSGRVGRGGGCFSSAQYCRSAVRFNTTPSRSYSNYGFRIAYHPRQDLYAVVDLSGGPDATHYPVRYSSTGPDLDDDTCRTTELWLRKIPAGTFIMGSPEDEVGRGAGQYNWEKLHQVTLTQDYYMGVFECTQKQWELIMGNTPSEYTGDCRPVERISFNMVWGSGNTADTTTFMGKLQTKTGMAFSLPTEAQWEYACRAGTTTALNSGKNLTTIYNENVTVNDAAMNEVGRYCVNRMDGKGGYSQHTKVGSYLPNTWGFYDMHGNVEEWCLDRYGGGDYSSAAVTDPLDMSCISCRASRGGCWGSYSDTNWGAYVNLVWCRSAARNCCNDLSYQGSDFGFRILCLP